MCNNILHNMLICMHNIHSVNYSHINLSQYSVLSKKQFPQDHNVKNICADMVFKDDLTIGSPHRSILQSILHIIYFLK